MPANGRWDLIWCFKVLYRQEQSKYWAEYERHDVKSCGGMGWGGKDVVANLN
jgi:hypothetical protein